MSPNKEEEADKPAADSQPKHSTSSTNATAKQPPPTQPKPIAAKPTAPTTTTTAAAKPGAAASPPKKEPEPPPFEKGLVERMKKKFGDTVKVVFIKPLRIKMYVEPHNIVEVATFLRDSMGFDHAESVAGTDYPKENQIEVIYHLGSYSQEDLGAHILWLTTRTNRDDARLPTLINVYKSVEYHERECYEMLGVYFEGHPRNERFLLPEDWADLPPLRRDFRIKGR
ncbi:MAG: NADH-quinone oxidoreductase subunit C [Thermoproteota archaeon]|nr:NADH-quinone oxidoreductase subunit C [Thermoproteota archaeon]